MVVDATFGHRIDQSERKAFDEAEANNEVVSPPAGAIGRGDAFVLRIADKVGGTVLSNDSFQEFHGEYDVAVRRGPADRRQAGARRRVDLHPPHAGAGAEEPRGGQGGQAQGQGRRGGRADRLRRAPRAPAGSEGTAPAPEGTAARRAGGRKDAQVAEAIATATKSPWRVTVRAASDAGRSGWAGRPNRSTTRPGSSRSSPSTRSAPRWTVRSRRSRRTGPSCSPGGLGATCRSARPVSRRPPR